MKPIKIKDTRRFMAGLVLFALSAVLLSVIAFLVLSKIEPANLNILSIIWIFTFHAIGLGIAAISASRNTDPKESFCYEYLVLYPISMLASVSALFLLFNRLPGLGNLIYYFEATISIYLGLQVDNLSSWLLKNN